MCDAVLQHTAAYSSKLQFSCIVTKRMSVIEFSATKIDITVQIVGLCPHTATGALLLYPVGGLPSANHLGFAPHPNLHTLATPVHHTNLLQQEILSSLSSTKRSHYSNTGKLTRYTMTRKINDYSLDAIQITVKQESDDR